MLLGSPPDMVHGHPLRETGSAAACRGAVPAYSTISFPAWQLKFLILKNLSLQAEKLWYNSICPSDGSKKSGLVAQLGERCVRIAEVEGSIPFESTN